MAGVAHALTPPPELPGRARLYSVPYCGRGQGSKKRLKKQPRVKLTKTQKKALKWARKHPEPSRVSHNNGTTNASDQVTVTLRGPVTIQGDVHNVNFVRGDHEATITLNTGASLYNTSFTNGMDYTTPAITTGYINPMVTADPVTLYDDNFFTRPTFVTGNTYTVTGTVNYGLDQFIGQPATQRVYQEIEQQVTLVTNNIIANGGDYTIDAGRTIVQDWSAWNTPEPGWLASCEKKSKFDTQWAGMCGRGHSADLWFNPNDQLQKRRLRNERDVLRAAECAQERMEWEANRPAREEAARVATAERQVVEAARQERRALAKDRSYALLHRHLTDEQLAMLENESRFLIEVNSGKVYEIRRGIHQNIYLLNGEGRITEQLCAAPRGGVPEGDAMLAQMLHLMVNEEEFRRVANIFNMADHRAGQVDRRLPLQAAA